MSTYLDSHEPVRLHVRENRRVTLNRPRHPVALWAAVSMVLWGLSLWAAVRWMPHG